MRRIILAATLLLSTSAFAADLKLKLNGSHVLDKPDEAVTGVLIDNSEILAATPIPNGGWHLHAIGKGTCNVTFEGSDATVEVKVAGKIAGKPELALARGRGELLAHPTPVTYANSGNPEVVHVTQFDSHHIQVVGVTEGYADLVVIDESGNVTTQLVEVDDKAEVSRDKQVTTSAGETAKVPLDARPTRVAVAHGGIAAAELVKVDADTYHLEVKGMALGVTDLFLGFGNETQVWKLIVE